MAPDDSSYFCGEEGSRTLSVTLGPPSRWPSVTMAAMMSRRRASGLAHPHTQLLSLGCAVSRFQGSVGLRLETPAEAKHLEGTRLSNGSKRVG